MYLRGSKWNLNRRTRRYNHPWRVIFFLFFIGSALYINQFVVPSSPAFSQPTATPTRSPESFINEALEMKEQGKFQQAVAAYDKAIMADPLNMANYAAKAQAQVWAGQYEEALESAEMSLIGNETYSLGHAVRGWALTFLGQYIEADNALRRAIDLDPNNQLAYAYQAELLIREGDVTTFARAIEASRKAYDLASNSLEALRARGLVLYNTGNPEESIQMYEEAIKINKNIPDLWMYLGYNYTTLQDHRKAIDMFMQANILNPTDSIPDLEISRLHANLGEFGKAVQYAENAVNDEPDNPNRYANLGVMLYRSGDLSAAIDAFEMGINGGKTEKGTVVQPLPLDNIRAAQYYSLYGFALARVTPNRCVEAVPVFQELMSAMPDYDLAVNNATEGLDECAERVSETATP
jgi:tetratricopeptide (TPR) repeat protein